MPVHPSRHLGGGTGYCSLFIIHCSLFVWGGFYALSKMDTNRAGCAADCWDESLGDVAAVGCQAADSGLFIGGDLLHDAGGAIRPNGENDRRSHRAWRGAGLRLRSGTGSGAGDDLLPSIEASDFRVQSQGKHLRRDAAPAPRAVLVGRKRAPPLPLSPPRGAGNRRSPGALFGGNGLGPKKGGGVVSRLQNLRMG